MKSLTRRMLAQTALAAAASPAFAAAPSSRLALVIANSDYDGDGKIDTSEAAKVRAQERGLAGDLRNPWFDSVRVSDALRGAGFQVETLRDADRASMLGSIMRLRARADAAGPTAATCIYFAGHGIQLGGRNYLVAAGARFNTDEMPTATGVDRERIGLAVGAPVQELLMRARNPEAPGYNVVLLDACRDNPWEPQIREAMAAAGRDYVGERGFVGMTVMTQRTVLSFSASPGQVANDGIAGAGSPYAAAIVRALSQRGAPIDRLIDGLVGPVATAAGGAQMPWRVGRIGDATSW